MAHRRLENLLLYLLLVLTGTVYLYTVAPTLCFWDCGEFIACSYTLGIPHPPGTPFYVVLGRVWLIILGLIAAILPISKEVAWHMNLLAVTFTLLTVFLVYRLLLKIFRLWQKRDDQLSSIIVAFATSLSIAFFYTIWENAIETEVYASSTFIFVLVNYLILLWYESAKNGQPKHRYLLMSFYLIYLATGIHLLPFLAFFPLYIFIFVVERRYIKDTLLLLLGIFQLMLFPLLFVLPPGLFVPGTILLIAILLLGLMLPFNNPLKYKNWRFFWIGIFLVVIGSCTELYLYIRSKKLSELYKDKKATELYLKGKNIAPRINECEPGENLTAFSNVLRRAQYGPQRIIPRQTQDQTGYSLIEGYFWQVAHFIRYLSWQIAPEGVNRFFRAILLTLFYGLGIWGIVELYRREKQIFLLMIIAFFMLSIGIITYLNLKFSPTDSNPKHQPREVRERDYFFHTTHLYFGIFMGCGICGFMSWLNKETKKNRLSYISALSGVLLFSLMPFLTNIRLNNRHKNFVPKDYGYNMLISADEGAIIFTNGDNDTFPLWFIQEVLGIKRDVIIANLSLINTDWYIRQLKYWGAPISFSEYVIKRLEPVVTPDRKVFYVKDIMIRDILATNAGIKLEDKDYFIPPEEFAAKVLKGYKGERPIYFASTVSPENYKGFEPYLRLEGILYRVVGDSIPVPRNVDVEKTINFFYNTYRYTSVFDPDKQKALASLLPDFERRKREGEFLDLMVFKDENMRRLYTNYAAGLHTLGLELKERADIQGAINAWRFALLFDPKPAYPFMYNLGLIYAQVGMLDSADLYFSKIDLKDPQLITHIASLYRMLGRTDKALEYFQKAVSINPRYAQGYMGLLATYLDLADTTAAVGILQNWLRMNPGDTSAQNMLKGLVKR